MPARQNQSRVTLIVDGRNLGVWDDKTGGDSDSNSTQYFQGGMGPRISLGGTQQVNNIVLSRLEDDSVIAFAKWLVSRSGKGKAVCSQQKLDDEGNPVGDPIVWTGKTKRSKYADVQSQSNSPAQFECEIEVDGAIA